MIICTNNTALNEIDFPEGAVIPIDKDQDWTSFDVVNKIRYALPVKKVGHAGTLDPLATGLVLICSGKYTKRLNELMGLPKTYTGTITLGATTPSYDLETPLEASGDPSLLTGDQILRACEQFQGEIMQTPPIFSAVKVDGERAYKKARKNEPAKLEPRQVNIHSFEVDPSGLPHLKFRLSCSKGTYVRSLAHDLGQELGVGAHLSYLRRTAIGEFDVEDAWNVQDFVSAYRNIAA